MRGWIGPLPGVLGTDQLRRSARQVAADRPATQQQQAREQHKHLPFTLPDRTNLPASDTPEQSPPDEPPTGTVHQAGFCRRKRVGMIHSRAF